MGPSQPPHSQNQSQHQAQTKTKSKPSKQATVPAAGDVMQALIRTTHHLHRQFELGLAARNIPAYMTGPRLRFLIAVAESGQVRMGDMADKLGIQARTVTQFVDALEQEQLLVRLPDPTDRRATILQITERAITPIAEARAAMAAVSEQVLEPLPMELRQQLLDLLGLLDGSKVQAGKE